METLASGAASARIERSEIRERRSGLECCPFRHKFAAFWRQLHISEYLRLSMVKLKADFISDWITCLRERLIQEGWKADEVQRLAERNVPISFFESRRRRLAPRPRLLKIADDFQCPKVDKVGWMALQKKVTMGADLNPHLSERHSSIAYPDGLLAEWQVNHFHLGTDFDPKNHQYMSRTGFLVFALVDDNSFCAINVFPHRTHWEEVGIVESIHRNWPDMISKYCVKGVTPATLDKNQRRGLRKHNGNVLVGTKDGTVYMPIGGASLDQVLKWNALCLPTSGVLKSRICRLALRSS
jgi:hypothetical protein